MFFEFHKNLFTLGFTMEKTPLDSDANEELMGVDLEDQNKISEGNHTNGQNGMDTDERGGNLPTSNLDNHTGGTNTSLDLAGPEWQLLMQ
jgi:hypothetical protein